MSDCDHEWKGLPKDFASRIAMGDYYAFVADKMCEKCNAVLFYGCFPAEVNTEQCKMVQR